MCRRKKPIVEDFSCEAGVAKWFEGNHFMKLSTDAPIELEVQSCFTFTSTAYSYTGTKTFDELAAEAEKYGLEGIAWNEDRAWERSPAG